MADVAPRTVAATRAGVDSKGRSDAAPALPLRAGAQEPHAMTASDEGALPAGDVIEPGRMLALADFSPPALSAGDRLVRLAYGLGMRGAVIGSFRKPAKRRLLATVANPLPGDRVAGTALRAGHFLLHGVKLPIEAAGGREPGAPLAERILAAWLDANPEPPARPAKAGCWTVALTGTRLLAWLVHAPLILSGTLRTRMLGVIDAHARWLDRHVTRGEDLLAQLAGWSGIIAAGLLLPDGRGRRLFGEAGLVHCLGELIGDDGGTLARSPLAQMEAIALLVRVTACYRALRSDPPQAVQGTLGLLVPPLLALTHGDGSLGSWQGGWAIAADEVARLIEATGVRTRPLREVRQWGYQRAVAQKTILQFDAAPPPMPRHARTGCASTLAFELSHAGQRIVVNCGGAAAAGGLIPARLEQGLRATAAHSTLVLDDANSTAVLINGRIGSGVGEVEVDRRTLMGERNGGATRIEASHDGYVARYGLIHRRILILRDDGTELRGEDLLVPTRGKGARGKVAYALRFHLGPGIEVGQSPDGQGVGLALPDGSYWQFRVGGGEVAIDESLWADGHARPVAVQQIVVQGLVSRGGGNFAWLFKRMG